MAFAHESESGVTDSGGAGISDQCDVLASFDPIGQFGRHVAFVLLAIGNEFCVLLDPQLAQKLASDACVLAGDIGGRREYFDGAWRGIGEVADWRSDECKGSGIRLIGHIVRHCSRLEGNVTKKSALVVSRGRFLFQ